MTVPLVYLAHSYGGDPFNLDKAESWCAQLSWSLPALFFAPWVPLCRQWVNVGGSLERGLMLDMAAIEHSNGVLLVGGKLSVGMSKELDHARSRNIPTYDLSDVATYQDLLDDAKGYSFSMLRRWVEGLG